MCICVAIIRYRFVQCVEELHRPLHCIPTWTTLISCCWRGETLLLPLYYLTNTAVIPLNDPLNPLYYTTNSTSLVICNLGWKGGSKMETEEQFVCGFDFYFHCSYTSVSWWVTCVCHLQEAHMYMSHMEALSFSVMLQYMSIPLWLNHCKKIVTVSVLLYIILFCK